MWMCPWLFLVVTWDSVAGSARIRFGLWGKAICSYESKKQKTKINKKDEKHSAHFGAGFNCFNCGQEWACIDTNLLNFDSPSVLRFIHWCVFGGKDDTHSVPLWESASSLASRRHLLSCCRSLLLYRQR